MVHVTFCTFFFLRIGSKYLRLSSIYVACMCVVLLKLATNLSDHQHYYEPVFKGEASLL